MTRRCVLVTGAGGFIGRWAVPPLLARGFEVHAVAGRAGHAGPKPVPPELAGAQVRHLDLFDVPAVLGLMHDIRPSHLLHFAWVATPGLYWTSPDNARWLAASQSLLTSFHANGGGRAVMAGSSAEYDWSSVEVCHELTSPLADRATRAITPYADCKIATHKSLENFGAAHRLSTAWGRVFFQYGPDEHPDRLVSSLILSLLAGREAKCSHGRQIRSFLHVADVGAAFAALLDSDVRGPVNIGSSERMPLSALIAEVAAQVGRPELVRLGARQTPASEPAVLVPDVGRLSAEVGWSPRYALRSGLADTIAWWRARSCS